MSARNDQLLAGRTAPAILLRPDDRPPLLLAPDRQLLLPGGGAVTVSGLFVVNWKKPFDGSDLVIDWVNDTIKMALFTNTITPNFSSDTNYGSAPYNANEVTGTAYVAGGATLASKTLTESPTGSLMFDCADPAWAAATFSSARCGLVWDDTSTSPADCALALVNFGADFAVTAGTFTVQIAATGLAAVDITP